ncbi:MAG: CbiQ family ECF transporter T component [Bryobacteraceae bacterium]
MAQRIGPYHFVFDEWSRGRSRLHRLDPRAKLAATLAALLFTSLFADSWIAAPLPALLAFTARLPVPALLLRAAAVLPFSAVFALLAWLAGDSARAAMLLWKPFASALWVVLLMAVTPLEDVLCAAAWFRAPRLLLEVMHFIWRYLGVLGEQARRMRTAALARGAERSFEVSAASLAVLLAASFHRAARIHRAHLARGAGRLP